jgi:hypothetical protein
LFLTLRAEAQTCVAQRAPLLNQLPVQPAHRGPPVEPPGRTWASWASVGLAAALDFGVPDRCVRYPANVAQDAGDKSRFAFAEGRKRSSVDKV